MWRVAANIFNKQWQTAKKGVTLNIWCWMTKTRMLHNITARFREKPEPAQLLLTKSLTATDLELNNSHISITDLNLENGTSQPFSNLTYSHPSGSNYKHNHCLFISICQHKSEDVKQYYCLCEVLSQHRRQHSNNLFSHTS